MLLSTLSAGDFHKDALKAAYQDAGCCPLRSIYTPCAIVHVPGYTATGFTCNQAMELHCIADADGMITVPCGIPTLCYGVHTEGQCATPALPASVAAVVIGSTDHTVLEEALAAAGLVQALQGDGAFTVFAPTDAAFTQALEDLGITKAQLLAKSDLAEILKNHVLSSKVLSDAIQSGTSTVTTLAETTVSVTKTAQSVTFGEATVTTANVQAANGVVHVIDKVVLPPSLVGDWKVTFLGVGPSKGTWDWWSKDSASGERVCYFDDVYQIREDGTFSVIMDDLTYLEPWQGVTEGCGAPVVPHNGSSARYTHDPEAGTLTVTGDGAFVGLPKVHNGGEDGHPSDDTIVYGVTTLETGYLVLDINAGAGGPWWRFAFGRSQ